jgi:hypothetical protein
VVNNQLQVSYEQVTRADEGIYEIEVNDGITVQKKEYVLIVFGEFYLRYI